MVSNDSEATGELELRQYLLGKLPPAQTERLDEMSIADDRFVERLRVVEDELIDAYVAGELPPDLHEPFRAQYLRTARGLQRIQFARALRDYRSSGAPSRAGAVVALLPTFSRRTLELAAAGIVLLALTVGYLVVENLRLRRELGDASSARIALAERERRLRQTLAEQTARERPPVISSAT